MGRRVARRVMVLVAGCGLLVAGCAAAPGAAEAPASGHAGATAGKADQLYVVDCLLPAQIKRLGRSMTFLGPRRAIKTSAVDCEIRGGEYVAYDRADHATALRVWLPLAQEGDKTAQVYVGEIYERGLGVPSDYALAAAWYRKAADQGYARAQINIGHLYEKGLGVPRDPLAALEWYRKASGLTELVALDTAGLSEGVHREVQELREVQGLRDEVQRQTRESEALRAQLDQARRQLDQARQDLARRSGEAEAGRERVEAMRRELAELRKQAEAARDDRRIRSLEVELEGARRQLDRAQQEIGQRSGEAEAGRQRVETMNRELAALRTRAVRDDTRVGALEAELERARQDLLRTRQDVERRTGEARAEQQRTEDLRRELARLQKQAEAARDDPRIKSLEAQLGQRQAEVDREGQEVTRLRQRVATLEAEAERERQRLTAVRDDRVAMAGPTIEMIEPSLLTTRGVAVVKVSLAAEPRERVIVGKVTAPAGLMLLTINDREETTDANGLFRAKIPVQASGVPIRLVAVDRQGKRGGIEFRMAPDDASGGAPAPAPKKRMPSLATGQYYALIIGNKTYSHWPSLRTAEVDARKTAELLEGKYGFKTRVLLNAGRYAILQALNELRNQLTEKDNLLIYYAGHGYLDEKINRAYWIPVDGQLDSNVDWIPTVAITDLVSAMSAKQILLVVDSCYSGALTRSALARLEAGMSDEARQHWLEVMAAKRSRTVLASGDVKPVLDIGGGQHSVFARAWLDVLTDNEEVLEGQRLYREIAARVAYAADALKFEQVPQYAPIRFAGHESGDFLFVPRDN